MRPPAQRVAAQAELDNAPTPGALTVGANSGRNMPRRFQLAALENFLSTVDGFGIVSGFAVNLPRSALAGLTQSPGMTGAVSGSPVETLVNEAIRELYRRMPRGRYAIIGAGGIRTAEDAYRKIRLGTSLVQLLTALIYHGPGVAARITRQLPALLARDGVTRISEVIGVDAHA